MGTSAAPEDVPPEPAQRDLQADLTALTDRIGTLLMQFTGKPGCERLTDELIITGTHLTEVKAALRDYTAGSWTRDVAFQAGRAVERAAIAEEGKARKGRHAAAASRKFGLRVVEGIAIAGVALKPLAGVAHHPVRSLLSAGSGTKVAVAGTAATLAVIGTTAAVVPHVSLTDPFGTSTGTPNPAASIYSATPIGSSPSALRLVGAVTKPKPGLDAKPGAAPIVSLGVVPSSSYPSSSSASWPSQQASQQQSQGGVQGGPATLSVGTTGLDLSGALTSATVTLSATGSGWVSWKVDTGGSDLDFSKTSGVLEAGESYTLTVSLASVLDSATEQIFDVNGQQVSVNLPLPPPVPTVSPTPLDSIVPSIAPSGG